MLDDTEFRYRNLEIELINALRSGKISLDEYKKNKKKLDEDYKKNKRQLRKISIFRIFLDYKICDLYVTDKFGGGDYCDILVKIGKTFDSTDLYYTYKNSYFMSLKSGKISEYPISNNYDQYFVEPLKKYITCDKDNITFKEAMIYFEEDVIIPLLLKRITECNDSAELQYRLDNLKREISNIKYSKNSIIKNKEQIENCACCKLIEISKNIFNYYYKIINRKEGEVLHLEHACYYLENCIKDIKAVINNFETLKRLIAENDELLKEKLILLGHSDFIECLDLVNTLIANIQYIEEFGKPKEGLSEEDISKLKKCI